jgi:hypothetical protein
VGASRGQIASRGQALFLVIDWPKRRDALVPAESRKDKPKSRKDMQRNANTVVMIHGRGQPQHVQCVTVGISRRYWARQNPHSDRGFWLESRRVSGRSASAFTALTLSCRVGPTLPKANAARTAGRPRPRRAGGIVPLPRPPARATADRRRPAVRRPRLAAGG